MRYRLLRYETQRDSRYAQWDIMEFYESVEEAKEIFNSTDICPGWQLSLVDMLTGDLIGLKV